MSDAWSRALLSDYRGALRRRNYATSTIDKRVTIARRYLEHVGHGWASATWHTVETFGETRGVGPSTWRDELSHLSTFYRWAIRAELVERNPAALVERPRLPGRLPRPAADHDYLRLVDGAGALALAIIELMTWCGVRCVEVANLRAVDVDMIHRVAIVRGKGDRERLIALPVSVVRALAAVDSGDAFVFVGFHGRPLQPHRVSQIVSERARAAGVHVTAHQLRHRFATKLLAETGRLEIVQHALGHASISTTQIYAQTDRRDVLDAMRRMAEHAAPVPRLFDDS